MPAKLRLELSDEEREALQRWTKNPPKPHLRRKAWALLLVADGQPAFEVAKDSRVRANRGTLTEWLERYKAAGLAGLKQKAGQGRKPAFFPSQSSGSSTAGRADPASEPEGA